MNNTINKLIRMMLDMAEYADTGDANKINDFFMHSAGMGCRAFSKITRNAVVEIINLINNYHSAVERYEYESKQADSYEKFFCEVLGCETVDPDFFTESEKAEIKALVDKMRQEVEDDKE